MVRDHNIYEALTRLFNGLTTAVCFDQSHNILNSQHRESSQGSRDKRN